MKKYYLKEDVEFERLKDFGFECRNYCEYKNCYVYEQRNDGWSNDEIIIYCDTRKIFKNYEDFENDYLQNKIDNLIEANLVEEKEV